MSKMSKTIKDVIIEEQSEIHSTDQKPTKQKKPWIMTEARQAAFSKCLEKRNNNREIRRLEKDSQNEKKAEIVNLKKEIKLKKENKTIQRIDNLKQVCDEEDDDFEFEKPKPKPKRHCDDDDDDELNNNYRKHPLQIIVNNSNPAVATKPVKQTMNPNILFL